MSKLVTTIWKSPLENGDTYRKKIQLTFNVTKEKDDDGFIKVEKSIGSAALAPEWVHPEDVKFFLE